MKRQLMLLLCAAAAISFAGCTKEADLSGSAQETPSVTESEGIGYMSFSLKADTRADGDVNVGDETFNPGTSVENALSGALNSHIAIFFDANGEYFGSSYLTPRNSLREDPNDHTDGDGHEGDEEGKYSTTEKLYTYITRDPRVSKNGTNPHSVLVLLNAYPKDINALLEKLTNGSSKLADIQQYIVGDKYNGIYKVGETAFYTMTNSAYIDEDGVHVETLVNGKVYPSPEGAAQNPVTIFVERVVAKHSLKISVDGVAEAKDFKDVQSFITPAEIEGESGKGTTTASYIAKFEDDGFEVVRGNWKAHIVGWSANAVEKSTFLYKNLLTADRAFSLGAFLNGGFGDWWNVPALHRSYWAIDPNYYYDAASFPTAFKFGDATVDKYPTQYTPVYKYYSEGVNGYTNEPSYVSGETDEKKWALDYFSYEDIAKGKANEIYTLENTYAYFEGLKNYAPLRYGTHMIVAAQLIFDFENGPDHGRSWSEGFNDEVVDKVYADGYYWSPKAYLNWAYKQVSEYIANGLAHTAINLYSVKSTSNPSVTYRAADATGLHKLYVKKNGKFEAIKYTGNDVTKPEDVFELAKTYLKDGDGKRAITLKSGAEVYYKVDAWENHTDDEGNPEEGYPEESDDDTHDGYYIELMDSDIAIIANMVQPAGAKYYKEGRMYYAVPVKHYNAAETSLVAKSTNEGADYEVGNFGTVRNHWYSFTIKKITRPGTPVEDEEDEIIPNEPEEYDYLGVEIVILPWHIIDQDVEL